MCVLFVMCIHVQKGGRLRARRCLAKSRLAVVSRFPFYQCCLDALGLGATAASGLADGAVFPVAAGRISDAFFEFQRSTDFGRLSMQFMRCVAGVVAADGFNGVSVSCWILGVESVCAVCSAHVNHPLPSFPVASFLLPMPLLALSYAPFVIGQAAYLLYGRVFPLEANKGAVFGLELMYTCHRKPVSLAVVVAMVALRIQGGCCCFFFYSLDSYAVTCRDPRLSSQASPARR